MQPVVTPVDVVIDAMNQLQSVIKKSPKKWGKEEIDILRQMDAILQGNPTTKHVTFAADTTPAKIVMKATIVHPREDKTRSSPRVDTTVPRSIKLATVNKPYGPPHLMTTLSQATAAESFALTRHVKTH